MSDVMGDPFSISNTTSNTAQKPVQKIGIWGTARSGKTTYLAMLYYAFERLSQHSEWHIQAQADHEPSQRFIEEVHSQLFEQKLFPEKTKHDAVYYYTISHTPPTAKPAQYTLEFLDAPGELFEKYYVREQRDQHGLVEQSSAQPYTTDVTPAALFAHLADCSGLLLFIDPGWKQSSTQTVSYRQLLTQLLNDLKMDRVQRGHPEPRVALCLTKVDGSDQLWQQSQQRHAQQNGDTAHCYRIGNRPQAECEANCALYDYTGGVFMNQLLNLTNPATVRCFSISSIGRVDDQPNVGRENAWQRGLTPMPPQFSYTPPALVESVAHKLTETRVLSTFNPTTINRVDQITPYALLEPLRWVAGIN